MVPRGGGCLSGCLVRVVLVRGSAVRGLGAGRDARQAACQKCNKDQIRAQFVHAKPRCFDCKTPCRVIPEDAPERGTTGGNCERL